jgi:hypothetical protein
VTTTALKKSEFQMSDSVETEEDSLSDEDKINEHLENLREAYNDQRIFDAVAYTESVHLIDETHADFKEWFLMFDADKPILRLERGVWKVEKGDGEWDDWSWEPDGELFAVDVTKEAIPWEMLEKETCYTSNDVSSSMAEKFVDKFGDLFFKEEDGEGDPNVVVDPILKKELETY